MMTHMHVWYKGACEEVGNLDGQDGIEGGWELT